MYKTVMRKIANALNTLTFIASLIVIILIALYVFILPRVFKINTLTVLSGSMEPTIHTGAVAFIDTKDKDVEIGDVITFELNSKNYVAATNMVTHRVVGVRDGGYVVRGDANDADDPRVVYPEQIVGTYKFQIPELGRTLRKFNKQAKIAVIAMFILWNILTTALSMFFEADEAEMEESAGAEEAAVKTKKKSLKAKKGDKEDDAEEGSEVSEEEKKPETADV